MQYMFIHCKGMGPGTASEWYDSDLRLERELTRRQILEVENQ